MYFTSVFCTRGLQVRRANWDGGVVVSDLREAEKCAYDLNSGFLNISCNGPARLWEKKLQLTFRVSEYVP